MNTTLRASTPGAWLGERARGVWLVTAGQLAQHSVDAARVRVGGVMPRVERREALRVWIAVKPRADALDRPAERHANLLGACGAAAAAPAPVELIAAMQIGSSSHGRRPSSTERSADALM